MREPLTVYDPVEKGVKMVEPTPILGDLKNPSRKANHIRNTYNTEDELYDAVMAIQHDWEAMAKEAVEWETEGCDDADVVIVSHGIVSRAALAAYQQLRAAGKKVGYFRPITVRPFPGKQLAEACKNAKKLLVAESAYGQLLKLVQSEIFDVNVELVPMLRPGVGITAEEIIEECNKL
jgi:2-oxoglutarate ferredoxin oxidoreductase subunit alpha